MTGHPPPVASRAEQETRAAALAVAAQVTSAAQLDDPTATIRDLEQITVGMAQRFEEWIATGRYDWMVSGTVPAPGAEAAVKAALMRAWRHLADDPVHAEQVAAVAVRAAVTHLRVG